MSRAPNYESQEKQSQAFVVKSQPQNSRKFPQLSPNTEEHQYRALWNTL